MTDLTFADDDELDAPPTREEIEEVARTEIEEGWQPVYRIEARSAHRVLNGVWQAARLPEIRRCALEVIDTVTAAAFHHEAGYLYGHWAELVPLLVVAHKRKESPEQVRDRWLAAKLDRIDPDGSKHKVRDHYREELGQGFNTLSIQLKRVGLWPWSPAKCTVVYSNPGYNEYHAADCAYLRFRGERMSRVPMTVTEARTASYQPCAHCQERQPVSTEQSQDKSKKFRDVPGVTVFTTHGKTVYHGPQCHSLKGCGHKFPLSVADAQSKGMRPCQTCRPVGYDPSMRYKRPSRGRRPDSPLYRRKRKPE